MSASNSAVKGENLKLISAVTKRLIAGQSNSIIAAIHKQLGVSVAIKNTGDPLHVRLQGHPMHVEIVSHMINELDQKAAIIAKEKNINAVGELRTPHWLMMDVHFKPLLAEAKKTLLGRMRDKHAVAQEALASRAADPEKVQKEVKMLKDMANKPRPRTTIKFLTSEFTPLNQSQALTYLACVDPAISYVYAAGPFGGGKTYTPLRAGLELYQQGHVNEIIIIRPRTTTGKKDPGAMPGDARGKAAPYIKGGIASNITQMAVTTLGDLETRKVMRAHTPDFERGETYANAFILVDEPQNLTMSEAELLIGRLGKNSKMVFAGDIGGNQNDLHVGEMPGLAHLIATQGSAIDSDTVLRAGTAFIRFTDSDSAARNPILPHVSKALREPPSAYASLMQTVREARRDHKIVAAIDLARTFAEQVLEKAEQYTVNRYINMASKLYPELYGNDLKNVAFLHSRGLRA